MEIKIKRGDMFYADLAPGVGSEQNGCRPILIVSNNKGNRHSGTAIAAIITSRIEKKSTIPTHCPIQAQQGLGRSSLVLLEQIQTIDKIRLKEYIGTLNDEDMSRIDKALAVSVGLKYGEAYIQINGKTSIGANIKRLRNQHGMTQKQLGVALGFNEANADVRIAQYESGARTPKKNLIVNIANTFNVDPAALTTQNIEGYARFFQTLNKLENLYKSALVEIDEMRKAVK